MNEKQIHDLQALKNILDIFRENNVIVPVAEINNTILFDVKTIDVPYKNALIAAGATFDIGFGCWTYWINDE